MVEIPLEEGPFFWKFPASPAIRGREPRIHVRT